MRKDGCQSQQYVLFQQAEKFVYLCFVLVLPLNTLGYFKNLLRSWSTNACIYPLLVGLLLIACTSLKTGRIYFGASKGVRTILSIFAIFLIFMIIATGIMSLFLETTGISTNEFATTPIKSALIKIAAAFVLFLAFYYVLYINEQRVDITTTIKTIYLSFAVVLIYGYIQMLTLVFPESIFSQIYSVVYKAIDFGWSITDPPETYPYVTGQMRLNLTTPEASEAGHLVGRVFYPFLLASLALNYSLFKRKILLLSVEAWLFFFSLPVLFCTFSTSSYIITLIMTVTAAGLYLSRVLRQRSCRLYLGIAKVLLLGALVSIAMAVIYSLMPDDLLRDIPVILAKFTSLQSDSSGTRYGFSVAALLMFLQYPVLGVGFGNSQFVFSQFIPSWAMNPEVQNYLSTGENLGTRMFWTGLLGEFGIIGTTIFIYWIITIIRYIRRYASISAYDKFITFSFYFYLLATILHGFNSSSWGFLWPWAMWGFFIAGASQLKNCSDTVL